MRRRTTALAIAATLAVAATATGCSAETPLIGGHGDDHSLGWEQARKQVTAARLDAFSLIGGDDWTGNRPVAGECTQAEDDGVYFQAHATGPKEPHPKAAAAKLAAAWRGNGWEVIERADDWGESGDPQMIYQVVTRDDERVKVVVVNFSSTTTAVNVEGWCGYGTTAYEQWDAE